MLININKKLMEKQKKMINELNSIIEQLKEENNILKNNNNNTNELKK